MGAPGMGVGAGLAARFRPGGVVQRQQIAPGLQKGRIAIGQPDMLEGAHQIPGKIIGAGEHAGRRVDAMAGHGDAVQDVEGFGGRGDVIQHRQRIHVLAVEGEVGIVGEQAARCIPAMSTDGGACRIGFCGIGNGLRLVAISGFQRRALAQRAQPQHGGQATAAVLAVRGKALAIIAAVHPVDEIPLRVLAQQPVLLQPRLEPLQHGAQARQVAGNDGMVRLLHRPVLQHADPGQREGGNDVIAAAGKGALLQPTIGIGFCKRIDRLRREPGIAADAIGDQHL